jgi:archaellum component FlaF (FlaF/FlaG flagellin family)
MKKLTWISLIAVLVVAGIAYVANSNCCKNMDDGA